VYERRTGGSKSKDKTKSEGNGNDDEAIPHLKMKEQELIGVSELDSDCAAQIQAMAVNPAEFDATLYPIAVGGVVRILNDDDEWKHFPIASFIMNETGTQAVGFVLNPPDDKTAFTKPLSIINNKPAEVYIEDDLLATLDGVGYPNSIHED
jgi:hypothetical protein